MPSAPGPASPALFSDDAAANVETLVDVLEQLAQAPPILESRRAALQALTLRPGQRILDAGCGGGEVARDLARLVGASGEIIALDFSAVVVAAASRRHDGSPVRYVQGDVTDLAFADGTFDSVRSERVLQHLAEPARAVSELVRVTRPGGQVCLIDTDWRSLAFDGLPEDLVHDVTSHFVSSRKVIANPGMGLTLRRRLVQAGLSSVTATPIVCHSHQLDASAVSIFPFLQPQVARQLGFLPADLFDRLFAAVDLAVARNEFTAAVTIWVSAGTVRAGAQ